jgi:ATP-binding cassette subfamily F protein 3
MIEARSLGLMRGGHWLFRHATFSLHPGWKVGVVGVNGSGKSSLFALLKGALDPDEGNLSTPDSSRLRMLEQESQRIELAALDYVLSGDEELWNARRSLALKDSEGVAAAHDVLERIDGYTAESRGARYLAGLGFSENDLARPVSEFSGGWQIRLNLARVLISRPETLLLDEPTNHLDLDATLWLEQWLREFRGTLLLISHDRDLLDSTIDHILAIEDNEIRVESGRYSTYERRRGERLANQSALRKRQVAETDRLQRFVDRFRAKATKARQAQSRIKALDRMEIAAAARVDSPIRFQFRNGQSGGNPMLALDRVSLGYDNKPVLRDLTLSIRPGMRLGLLGRNGAGKSTLIKALSGILKPLCGTITPSKTLSTGYFAQHQLDQLDLSSTAVDHLLRLSPGLGESSARSYLGGFGFSEERALVPVAPFSGGEKARLCLALLIWQSPNLLLLDEPTNHLDIGTRDALVEALSTYDGAVVVVSHDRYLLRTCCDEYALVTEGHVQEYEGSLEDYARWLAGGTVSKRSETATGGRRAQRRDTALARQQKAEARRPLTRRIEQLEQEMSRIQNELNETETRMGEPALYQANNSDELAELTERSGRMRRKLTELEDAWLEVQTSMENMV